MKQYKMDGSECTTAPRGLKLRLADVYKNPGQTSSEIMAELNTLTDADKADFKSWFEADGYPVL